ncbi:MAG TPA: PRC-barrel domain-containing protein [Herpetosiphonaceae bacterium]
MEDISHQLREGMEIQTSDGTKLGKISEIWFGTSVGGPIHSEEETCVEVHRGFLGRDHLFLPCRVISGIDQNTVMLSVDAETVDKTAAWHQKPAWIR